MQLQNNVSLKPFNTFGIDVKAKTFVSVNSVAELQEVLKTFQNQSKLILGGGSNMLLTKDVDAVVIHLNIKGIELLHQDTSHVVVKAFAGENWHEFVLWCLKNNYGGVENLSLIPGNIGAVPIQNIGAYGVEIKDVLESCEAMHIETGEIKSFSNKDCNFGYRESVFKQSLKNKYVIINVSFKLTKNLHQLKIGYGDIKTELEKQGVDIPNINDISQAVIRIRQSKLPDPKEIGNSGSFFKNPIISISKYQSLLKNFPNMPNYQVSDNLVKVPAGWLIEHAGFKGKTMGNYGVHKKQALVLVNYGGADGENIYNLAKLIQLTVKRIFDIEIEMEVNVLH
jgi:UDP-N-acetylmuramate dehydrogenase